VSAALAAGEQCGIGGTQFLRSVVLGYDVGPRVMMTLGGGDFEAKTHRDSHSIANTFGAAAAAGCAFSLSAQQMRWVLDYAAQQTSGIAAWQRDKEHIEKAFVFGGMTARSGVTAALLVHSGWTGVDDIFSGTDNFLMANAPGCDPHEIIDNLGGRYEVTRTNIKKWTVGSPIQAPLDALELLMKQHHFTADQVDRVVVRVATREAYIVNNREMPSICLQHMIAVMLVDGTVSFHSAEDKARMQDPAILRQRAKVQLVSDDELERRLPRREATVEVILTDKSRLSQHVDAVRGTAENPMNRDEIMAKSRDLIAPVLGPDTCTRLLDRVLAIDDVKDVRELRTLLQPA
jgi:2-methylcitrate dehydratase PrpD